MPSPAACPLNAMPLRLFSLLLFTLATASPLLRADTAPVPASSPAASAGATASAPIAGAPVTAAEVATAPSASARRYEWLYELDPYYSSLGIEIPLHAGGLPEGGALREVEVYRRLLRESLTPDVFMLEASVYPMPALGSWLKKHEPGFYGDFEIGEVGGNSLNVLEGLTAGFQEPWAISAFLGSAMSFTPPGARADADNRAYMGYLVSAGKKHIRNNVLIDDDWWELEWKLKGERQSDNEKLSWSFRIGVKNHGNPDIVDVAFIGLRRSNLDYAGPLLSFLTNSTLETLTEVDRRTLRFLRQEITLGRKIPFPRRRFALVLDVGLVYEDDAKYRGTLVDPDADDFTVIFRPNLKF